MIKNKFNIGQRVIGIIGGKAKEVIISSIEADGDSLKYSFEARASSIKVRAGYDPAASAVAVRLGGLSDVWMDVVYDLAQYNEKLSESEIFENEEDFRANVKINVIAPTTEELKGKLRGFDTGDKEINQIIKAVV